MFNLLKFKDVNRAVAASTTLVQPIPEGTTLEQLGSELIELMRQECSNHHRMGVIYNYIVDNRLPQKAGYQDAKEYFSKKLADLSQTTLTTYGAMARVFSEPVARRFGVTCLNLLLVYKEAADLEINPEEPGPTPIEVPDEQGQVSTLEFRACSVEQMRRAIQRKRKPSSSKQLPAEALELGEQYSAAVAQRFPKGKLLRWPLRGPVTPGARAVTTSSLRACCGWSATCCAVRGAWSRSPARLTARRTPPPASAGGWRVDAFLLPTRRVELFGGGGNRTHAGRCETSSRIAPLPRNRPE